jgi:single-strand DNA-binding protein
MYLNQAIISGRVTRDPEMKKLENGNDVTNFSLATNSVYFNKTSGEKKETVEFHNITVFGNQAEPCARFLRKGQLALVVGKLQTRSWERPDGSKAYATTIIADKVQFGPGKTPPDGQNATKDDDFDSVGQSNAEEGNQSRAKKPAGKTRGLPLGPAVEYPKEEINPDDIPF